MPAPTSDPYNGRSDIGTATQSKQKMAKDVPAAKRFVEEHGAHDLLEMIFGDALSEDTNP